MNARGAARRALPARRSSSRRSTSTRQRRAAAVRFTCSIARRSGRCGRRSHLLAEFRRRIRRTFAGAIRRTSTSTTSSRSTSCTGSDRLRRNPRCRHGRAPRSCAPGRPTKRRSVAPANGSCCTGSRRGAGPTLSSPLRPRASRICRRVRARVRRRSPATTRRRTGRPRCACLRAPTPPASGVPGSPPSTGAATRNSSSDAS